MINSYPVSTFCIFAVADGIDSFVDIHETSIELNKEIWWPYVVPNTDIKKKSEKLCLSKWWTEFPFELSI